MAKRKTVTEGNGGNVPATGAPEAEAVHRSPEEVAAIAASESGQLSKAEAVREVLRHDPDLTASSAVPLIRERFRIEITPAHFTAQKGTALKQIAKERDG